MDQDDTQDLSTARAAILPACREARRLLVRVLALREARDATAARFRAGAVPWSTSPECYAYEKALRPLAERLYELHGTLFRLCDAHRCAVFDPAARATRPVNRLGECAWQARAWIAAAGFADEPAPWSDPGHPIGPADPCRGLPEELADLPSLQWAAEQQGGGTAVGRRAAYLVVAAVLLLGAAGASVSGILSGQERGVGLLVALALTAGGGWLYACGYAALRRRLRRYRLLRKRSIRLLTEFRNAAGQAR